MGTAVATARLAAAAVALSALGCEGRPVVAVDHEGGADAGRACPRHWSVTDTHANPELAVAVASGALTIALPLAGDEIVSVRHDGTLTGDFDVAFDFDVFAPGATAAFLEATLRLDDPALTDMPYLGAGIGVDDGDTDVRALLVYHDHLRTRFDLKLTEATAGTLHLARVGRKITLTATVPSGESATISEDVSDAPASIGLRFASGVTDAVTGEASVRLTDFRVAGGGGTVASDAFDCDSLLDPTGP